MAMPELPTLKLLVIDDSPIDRELYRQLLKKSPAYEYVLMNATSGQEGYQLIQSEPVDCVLLDYMLQDINGLDVLTKLSQDMPELPAPVIMLTAQGNERIAVQAMKNGASDYLIKGQFDAHILENAIHHAIDQGQKKKLEQERIRLLIEIEERKRVEAQLQAANVAKSEFLAMMSHELRTPLNVILGFTEALHEKIYGDLNERQLKALKAVQKSGYHLLELITDLLDYANIDIGKLELDRSRVAVEFICQSSLASFEQKIQNKHLRTTLTIDPRLDTIHIDERRLRKILLNLFDNAIKFTPEHGEVGLTVEQDDARQHVRFMVSDTGIGIRLEDQERIFLPFVQLDSKLSRKYEGAGLGLALVKSFVTMLDGSITVESEPGKGSRFILTLPNPSP